jgi:hypothetical protein
MIIHTNVGTHIKKYIMRIILYISIFTLVILACKNKTEKFQQIDYSCFIDPAEIYSVKISCEGHANIYTYNKYWNSKYYYDLTLDKAIFDSLTQLSELIMNSNFDSFYSLDCERCLSYCLIIKTNKRNFKIIYHGQLFTDKSLILLDRFSRNINFIVQDRRKSVDSIYRFESWSKYILPPPPPGDSNYYDSSIKDYLPYYH